MSTVMRGKREKGWIKGERADRKGRLLWEGSRA